MTEDGAAVIPAPAVSGKFPRYGAIPDDPYHGYPYTVMVRLPASAGRIPGLIARGSGAAPEKVRERSAGCEMPDRERVKLGIPDACNDRRVGIKKAPGFYC